MNAGYLRHRCWIKQATHTADGYGGKTTAWGTVTVCWGSLEPLRGREFIESGLENSERTGRFRMRFYDGIMPNMQLYFLDRTFEILSVANPGERNRELELVVRELVIA